MIAFKYKRYTLTMAIGIFFKKVDGFGSIFMEVDVEKTVWEIKHQLYKRLDYPPPWIYLTWNGKHLANDKTFSFYEIPKASTIHICGRLVPTMAIKVIQENVDNLDSEFMEGRWYQTLDDIKNDVVKKYGTHIKDNDADIIVTHEGDTITGSHTIPEYLEEKYFKSTNMLVFVFNCYIKN